MDRKSLSQEGKVACNIRKAGISASLFYTFGGGKGIKSALGHSNLIQPVSV